MARFFLRNSPDTIKKALELTEQEFVKHFSDTPSTPDLLIKAYNELRAVHKPKEVSKEVTFKVIQTDKKVVPITSEVKDKAEKLKKTVDASIKRFEENLTKPVPETFQGLLPIKEEEEDLPELTHEQEREEGMLQAAHDVEQIRVSGSGKTADDPVTVKKSVGRQPLPNAALRDKRILELLRIGHSGREIVDKLRAEGLSVFAPQITAIKKKNDL